MEKGINGEGGVNRTKGMKGILSKGWGGGGSGRKCSEGGEG
jgi:hypothetical protein